MLNFNPPVDYSNGMDLTKIQSIHRELQLNMDFISKTAKKLGLEISKVPAKRGRGFVAVKTSDVPALVELLYKNSSEKMKKRLMKTIGTTTALVVPPPVEAKALGPRKPPKAVGDIEEIRHLMRKLTRLCKEHAIDATVDGATGKGETHRIVTVTESFSADGKGQ